MFIWDENLIVKKNEIMIILDQIEHGPIAQGPKRI
jgi:hypothetical protein